MSTPSARSAPRAGRCSRKLSCGCLPSVITGFRVGAGFAFRGLIFAEMIAAKSGLGYLIFEGTANHQTDRTIVGMIAVGLLWLFLDNAYLKPFERATVERWGQVTDAAEGGARGPPQLAGWATRASASSRFFCCSGPGCSLPWSPLSALHAAAGRAGPRALHGRHRGRVALPQCPRQPRPARAGLCYRQRPRDPARHRHRARPAGF